MSDLEAARKAQLAEHERRVERAAKHYDGEPVGFLHPDDAEALSKILAEPTAPSDAPDHQPGFVLQAKTGGYLVLSRSTPGAWWLVYGKTCSCPAGRSGLERCWHRRQVAAFVALLNEDRKRPTAPPNISAMCD